MNSKLALALALSISLLTVRNVAAQDLGPNIRKIKEGIYVYVGNNLNSNCGIILTQEGVVLIDSGHNPTDSRAILEAVKKLTPMPVRFLIDTEPHNDHTTGHFVFSPPATVIAHEGATASMKQGYTPERNQVDGSISRNARGFRGLSPGAAAHRVSGLNDAERRR
jgi:cyclase